MGRGAPGWYGFANTKQLSRGVLRGRYARVTAGKHLRGYRTSAAGGRASAPLCEKTARRGTNSLVRSARGAGAADGGAACDGAAAEM